MTPHIRYCEDCRVDFYVDDFGDPIDTPDEPHMAHEWSNPNWQDNGE